MIMKSLLVSVMVFVFIACSNEDMTPTAPVNDMFDPTGATVLKSGMFEGVGGHAVTGTAVIYSKNNSLRLVLDPFMSQNGPDLRVYVSKNAGASSFLNLGLLKSVNGKQSYSIPGNPNLTDYTYVLVWCQKFSVSFGSAELAE